MRITDIASPPAHIIDIANSILMGKRILKRKVSKMAVVPTVMIEMIVLIA